MVQEQIAQRGIADPRILNAFRKVPRHRFMPQELHARAYEDKALPIGYGQTISQPYMVAIMLNALALQPEQTVLEIGSGCGYQAALLSLLVRDVQTVEIVPELAALARQNLLPYTRVTVHLGDGAAGYLPGAPYDAIIVAAATKDVAPAWIAQLRDGGRLILPVGTGGSCLLTLILRRGNTVERTALGECSFVPLTGEMGLRPNAAKPSN